MLSSRQFAEWIAYNDLEPFGEERADLRSGIIAAILANVHRDAKKRPQGFSPLDFMPLCKDRHQKQSVEDKMLIAEMVTEACKDRKHGK